MNHAKRSQWSAMVIRSFRLSSTSEMDNSIMRPNVSNSSAIIRSRQPMLICNFAGMSDSSEADAESGLEIMLKLDRARRARWRVRRGNRCSGVSWVCWKLRGNWLSQEYLTRSSFLFEKGWIGVELRIVFYRGFWEEVKVEECWTWSTCVYWNGSGNSF